MRVAATMLVAFGLMLGYWSAAAVGDEKDEVTLKGKITCAKCDLKLAKKCNTVVKVKDTVYWFDKESNKKYHGDTCMEAKEGTVTGTVSEKEGKKWVHASKVEYK